MVRSIPTARQIDRVFQLGYVITGDPAAALNIAAKAADGWERTVKEQRTRPRSKVHPERLRQKLIMNTEHALQFLTYKLCEPVEKAQERDYLKGTLMIHEHFFIIRYIKYLLCKSVPHRSFHVSVGLCRLLYDYTKRETAKIYDTLAQDDVRLEKDDQSYKDWKLSLIGSLQKRFPGLLSVETGPRGVTRFVKMADQKGIAEVVMNSLHLFTPWKVSCALPTDLKIGRHSFQPFKFTGNRPDEEHPVEERRMYMVINPDCFSVLTHALQLDSSYDRLAVPYFNLPPGDKNKFLPPPDFSRLPHLTPDEMFDITDYLNRNRKRRQTSKARSLSVEVDGVERTAINLDQEKSLHLTLEEDDDLIQVFTKADGEKLLLASLLLSGSGALEDERPWQGSVDLPGGKEIRIVVTPSGAHAGEVAGALVQIEYQEAQPFMRLMPAIRDFRHRFIRAHVLIPATAVIVIVAAVLLFNFLRPGRGRTDRLAQTNQPEQNAGPGETAVSSSPHIFAPDSPNVNSDPSFSKGSGRTAEAKSNRGRKQHERTPPSREAPAVRSVPQVASLSGVHQVYVNTGNGESEKLLHDALVETLRASGRFAVVENREQADAVLTSDQTRGSLVTVQLLSGAQKVLWHTKVPVSREDPAMVRAAAEKIVQSLLDDAERPERLRPVPNP